MININNNFIHSFPLSLSLSLLLFSVASGVECFKKHQYEDALKYFNYALEIDTENVEAMVARGAL